MAQKKAHSRQKESFGFRWSGTICHGTSRSSPSMVPEPMKDPTAHQNVLFSFLEASFESDTIFDESGRIRELSCGGARQWQEDVDGLGVFDDGAVFLERGGGAVGQWFLDSVLRQDFGILDMNGIRAAYRAVKTPPPCCL